MAEIKETVEVIDGLEVLAVVVAKALKDGKINSLDLPLVGELWKGSDKLVDAIKGCREIPEEVKDLDQAELITLGLKAKTLVENIVKASRP